MVVGGIQERIKKMKQAILSEAQQRQKDIEQKAQDQADIERATMIKHAKQKIQSEYSHELKNQKVKAKIQKSSVINRERIKKMQKRYELIEQLRNQLQKKLQDIINDEKKYKELLKKLILQGMLKMMERNIFVEVRKQHVRLVKDILPECERQFSEIMKRQTTKQMSTSLEMSQYTLQDKHKNIIGGVFLRSHDGLIVCDNSFDARVRLVFQQLLPVIRSMTFNKNQQ